MTDSTPTPAPTAPCTCPIQPCPFCSGDLPTEYQSAPRHQFFARDWREDRDPWDLIHAADAGLPYSAEVPDTGSDQCVLICSEDPAFSEADAQRLWDLSWDPEADCPGGP